MIKDWFKHWFNSSYYFLLYQNRNEEEAKLFFDLIKRSIPLDKNWKILDFCCGFGRLSKVIAREGFKVTGVDLSEIFIKHATEESKKENLEIEFIQCDVRNFVEDEKYHLGISFFTSFGYFSDQENELTFNNLVRSIVKNGWVVFDYFNPDFVSKNLVENENFINDQINVEIFRKIEGDRINKVIRINSTDKVEEYIESVRIYSFEELSLLFKKNGMSIQKIFGDYSGSDFNEDSPRIIIFAKKK
ncbi:MAG: class I SAM-dependent methyltransferase [Ignavibacteria bacterium]|jgi:SAM-dependent methyltransferase|nr:class I SAM-dependent methyltransferase [Ignavibacteria bacterium]MDH7527651.1 class I SAM-dependent methyltransferase [Ignavibacteria bacterium]